MVQHEFSALDAEAMVMLLPTFPNRNLTSYDDLDDQEILEEIYKPKNDSSDVDMDLLKSHVWMNVMSI